MAGPPACTALPGSPEEGAHRHERRALDDRREDRRRPRPGRRITDLETYDGAHLTVQDFALYVGLHPKTVMKWIDGGQLPAYRFGTDIRIRTADAVTFMQESLIRPASTP